MRSKNRKFRQKTDLATKAAMESFGGFRVTVKGFGHLSIFAESARAAEQVARRILGGGWQPYEGVLEVCREEKTVTRRQRT